MTVISVYASSDQSVSRRFPRAGIVRSQRRTFGGNLRHGLTAGNFGRRRTLAVQLRRSSEGSLRLYERWSRTETAGGYRPYFITRPWTLATNDVIGAPPSQGSSPILSWFGTMPRTLFLAHLFGLTTFHRRSPYDRQLSSSKVVKPSVFAEVPSPAFVR